MLKEERMVRLWRCRRVVLVLFASIGLAALCFAHSLAAAESAIYPPGITQSSIIGGVAPGSDSGSCCWLGESASFRVTPPPGADTLLIQFYIPTYAVRGLPQSFSVRLNDLPPQVRCCFLAGTHRFAIAIPPGAHDRSMRVSLRMAHTFVPARIGIGGDTRHLSVLLRSVGYLNTVTGERYEGTSVLTNSPTGAKVSLFFSLVGGLLALFLTRKRPAYGAIALLGAAPFALYFSIDGTTVTLPKAVLIGVAIGLAFEARKRAPRLSRTFWLLAGAQCALIISMILSSFVANYAHQAVRETLKDIEFLAVFVLGYSAYRVDPDERLVRFALASITILVASLALLQEIVGAPQSLLFLGHSITRLSGPLEGPNQLSAYLGIVVPSLAAFIALRSSTTFERIALIIGTIATFLTFSRGGIAALLLAFVLIFLLTKFGRHVRIIAAGLVCSFVLIFGIACAVMSGHAPAAARFFGQNTDAYNGGLGTRSELWSGAYTLWREHPLLGVGPGNFELEISRFAPGVRTHANSAYFQVLAEQGALGEITLFVLMSIAVGIFFYRCKEPLPLAGLVVASVMAFHQIVDTLWIYPKVGITWWLLIALAAAARDLVLSGERTAL